VTQKGLFEKTGGNLRMKNSAATRLKLLIVGPGAGIRAHPERDKLLCEHFEVLNPEIPEPAYDLDGGLRVLTATIEAGEPQVLMAGSRGVELLARLIERKVWQGATLLLGASHSLDCVTALAGTCVCATRVPIIFVHGTYDEAFPVHNLRVVCAASPWAKLMEIDDEHDLNTINGLELVEHVHEAYLWAQSPKDEHDFDVEALEQCSSRLHTREQLHSQAKRMAQMVNASAAVRDDKGCNSGSDSGSDSGWED